MGMSWNLNPTKYDISLANGQWSRLSPWPYGPICWPLPKTTFSKTSVGCVCKVASLASKTKTSFASPAPAIDRRCQRDEPRGQLRNPETQEPSWMIAGYSMIIIANHKQWTLIMPNSNIFIYISYIYLELPYPKKRGFCKISQFSEWKPGFPLAASSAAFDAGLLTGFYWIFTNFYGIFTGFRQVSKTSSSSKSRFSVPKPLFLGFRSKTWFLVPQPTLFQEMEVI